MLSVTLILVSYLCMSNDRTKKNFRRVLASGYCSVSALEVRSDANDAFEEKVDDFIDKTHRFVLNLRYVSINLTL